MILSKLAPARHLYEPLILETIPTSDVSKKFSTKVPFRMIIFWFVPEKFSLGAREIHLKLSKTI